MTPAAEAAVRASASTAKMMKATRRAPGTGPPCARWRAVRGGIALAARRAPHRAAIPVRMRLRRRAAACAPRRVTPRSVHGDGEHRGDDAAGRADQE